MRIRNRRRLDPLWIAAGLLAGVLPALAVTQYLWLTRLSDWQQRRTLQLLQAGAGRLAEEFCDALEPLQSAFQLIPPAGAPGGGVLEAQLAAAWRHAAEKSALPVRDLVRRVLWIAPGPGDGLEVQEFIPEGNRLQPCAWPAELSSLEASLREIADVPPTDPGRIGLRLEQGTPVLLVPPVAAGRTRGRERFSLIILVLDRDVLAGRFLPALVQRYLAREEALDLQVAVACTTDPPSLLYASEPGLTAGGMARHDAAADLLRLRRQALLIVRSPSAAAQGKQGDAAVEASPAEVGRSGAPAVGLAPQDWQLLVRHRAGSVETWVRRVRTRNMLLSAGILAALAASILVLLTAAARTRKLAQLQMEFISSVSHELRTPLAVISAAGENLADAVVGDPSRTREYGRIIHREGRRLGRMVDRVLQFARLQAEPRGRTARPVPPGELIAEALETYRLEIGERRIVVRTELPGGLPSIHGDREALVAALENLLSNAIKYGGDEGEVTVQAAAASLAGRPAVEISVSDRGPGIPESERARVFEPFVRGRTARELQIKGSGLGLSLVRDVAIAHGGRVRIDGVPAGGARIALILPAGAAAVFRGGSAGSHEEARSAD